MAATGGREGRREGGKGGVYLEQECEDGGGALFAVQISVVQGP